MKLKEFFVKNKEIVQLIYGVILIIIIPTLIVANTILIINRYNRSIDTILQRQALTFGRSIYFSLKDDLINQQVIQKKIKELKQKNADIEDLTILYPQDESFKIVATTEEKNLNKIISFYFYNVAWSQPDNDGLATNSLNLASLPNNELLAGTDFGDRFWLVAMPMSSATGTKQALLSIKLSSKIVDELTVYNRNASIFLLFFTVLIIVLFLAVSVRLWDYAILYKKIKEVDQMKDEFISMASHELRTPITGIRGYISMILEGSFGEVNSKVKENMQLVQNSAGRLSDLVEDLLNVSRIEQNRLEINLQEIDVNKIIIEVINELKIQADQKQLILDYKPAIEQQYLINVDLEKFRQVLINLIGNAIKYTIKGGVEIFVEKKDKLLEIRIKDTGVGMSAEERQQLFEKFYRVKNETTKNIIGTGLGLWITKRIVELMKGTIVIDSIKDTGTQATINFPIK
ncbi:HAMP domain-containing histidine kinase [Patescibacteria group bacterium]|nr:HAMP domain-containing histidine kinase [Patescibacteria group bacterium]MBU0879780.1 HAMP domain-containing histidine kinase [Patescibacteria group bacterium]MBU0879905.1 HAMP domain-containing histidine kinase [Patescibacteria group bacterium]MBU0897758.1 HAMP domain-containing histidine kinase [Patescibacteria group bacterium]MBU1783589.1 HAMP domain-containing histidine kinase [Patescibacteria group bacterium]